MKRNRLIKIDIIKTDKLTNTNRNKQIAIDKQTMKKDK